MSDWFDEDELAVLCAWLEHEIKGSSTGKRQILNKLLARLRTPARLAVVINTSVSPPTSVLISDGPVIVLTALLDEKETGHVRVAGATVMPVSSLQESVSDELAVAVQKQPELNELINKLLKHGT